MNEIQITSPKRNAQTIYQGMLLLDSGGLVCIVCRCNIKGECDIVRLEDGYAERTCISYDRLNNEIEDLTYRIVSIGTKITLTVKGK